jgi:hypothetical protein
MLDDAAVQGVTRAAFRSGTSEFHQQLIEQLGHGVIDELRAVVGVKAQNEKRELMQRFQTRAVNAVR